MQHHNFVIKLFLSFLLIFGYNSITHAQVVKKRTTLLMGGRFDITIVGKDTLDALKNIEVVVGEITRIENLISDWIPTSQVSKINDNAGIQAIKVDRELFDLTKRALKLSELTNGAFDISFAALDKVWKFDGSMTEMPTVAAIKRSVENVGYKNIELDSIHSTVFLKKKGMKIGFGALGEGYAADQCRELMLKNNVNAGIVNASGDMRTWGNQPNGKPWKIGITNPFNTEKLLKIISIKDGAVTTSGSYEKFVNFDGKRYSHIINPATGYPSTGLCSVTVIGPSAEFSNSISTSIMVLGRMEGLRFIKQYPQYSCLLITDTGKIIKSKNFRIINL